MVGIRTWVVFVGCGYWLFPEKDLGSFEGGARGEKELVSLVGFYIPGNLKEAQ